MGFGKGSVDFFGMGAILVVLNKVKKHRKTKLNRFGHLLLVKVAPFRQVKDETKPFHLVNLPPVGL